MTYQDLKTLEANKVITVKTVENWSKADNGRCYRIVTANFGKASLYFVEYEYVDMLRFSTYITSTNKLLSACTDLAQKAFKKLENKLEIIKCNKLNSIIKAKESAAQAEENNESNDNKEREISLDKEIEAERAHKAKINELISECSSREDFLEAYNDHNSTLSYGMSFVELKRVVGLKLNRYDRVTYEEVLDWYTEILESTKERIIVFGTEKHDTSIYRDENNKLVIKVNGKEHAFEKNTDIVEALHSVLNHSFYLFDRIDLSQNIMIERHHNRPDKVVFLDEYDSKHFDNYMQKYGYHYNSFSYVVVFRIVG